MLMLAGPPRLGETRRSLDPDGLDVHELAQTLARELASVAGLLHAAERHAWIALHHRVDERASAFERAGDALATLEILRPDAAAETEHRRVGELDRFLVAAHAEAGCNGAEKLLAPHAHLGLELREHGGLVVVTLPRRKLAAREDARAAFDRIRYLAMQLVAQVAARDRRQRRGLDERIAGLQRARRFGERRRELVVDALVHDE